MDKKLTTLATLALLGSVQSAATARKYATGDMTGSSVSFKAGHTAYSKTAGTANNNDGTITIAANLSLEDATNKTANTSVPNWLSYTNMFDPLKRDAVALKNADAYDTEMGSNATVPTAYHCLRTGMWYFYPVKLTANLVVTGTAHTAFYGEGADVTKLTVAATGSRQMKTDATWENEAVARLNGNAVCCSQLDINGTVAKCKSVATAFKKKTNANAYLTTATEQAQQIPVSRLFSDGFRIQGGNDNKWNSIRTNSFSLQGGNHTIDTAAAGAQIDTTFENKTAKDTTPAGSFGGTTGQHMYRFNDDFLLASSFQFNAGSDTKCSKTNTAAGEASNWIKINTAYSNTSGFATPTVTNLNKKQKCTWFIAVDNNAGSSNSAGASFLLTGVSGIKWQWQLHYAEWSAGSLTAMDKAGTVTPFFTGKMDSASTWEFPTVLAAVKKTQGGITAVSQSLAVDQTDTFMWSDDFYNSVFGMTPGFILFNGKVKGPQLDQLASLDYAHYYSMLTDHNALVTTYNTDAKTYSDLATKYLDAVTKRKAQLADPMKASFETPVAVPKVPCLANKAPTWTGMLWNSSEAASGNTATQPYAAGKTSNFSLGWPKLAMNTPDAGYQTINLTSGKYILKTLTSTDSPYTYNTHSGWIQVHKTGTAGASLEYGIGHVFGLMGVEGDTDIAKTKTLYQGKKAMRFYKEATASNEKIHFMMFSVLPYDNSVTYATASSSTVSFEVYKNDWEELSFTATSSVAPTKEVKSTDQLGAVRAFAASAAAFAAIAMTLQ